MTPDARGLEFLASAMAMATASVDRLNQVPARLAFLFDYDAARALADPAVREEMRGEGARAVVARAGRGAGGGAAARSRAVPRGGEPGEGADRAERARRCFIRSASC